MLIQIYRISCVIRWIAYLKPIEAHCGHSRDISSLPVSVAVGRTIVILPRFCSNLVQTNFTSMLTACTKTDRRIIIQYFYEKYGYFGRSIPVIFPILGRSFGEFQNYSEEFFKNCSGVVFF